MKRVVITGISVQTPLSSNPEEFYAHLLAGSSVVGNLPAAFSSSLCKVGGVMGDLDVKKKLLSWEGRLPLSTYAKLRKVLAVAPWPSQLSALLALEAWQDASLFSTPVLPERVVSIAAGHNINMNYIYKNYLQFKEEPSFIDPFCSLHGLDTNHAATVSELVQAHGGTSIVGGACASGHIALRNAVDELRHHEMEVAVLTAPVYDFSPVDLHSMCMMGAVSYKTFNNNPKQASRPFDGAREGFVPSHGAGVLIVETLESALRRGVPIYAEILGVEMTSDGNHLPVPSEEGQFRVLSKLFNKSGVDPSLVDFVSAHATSTQTGDLAEIRALKRFFGAHAQKLKINAPKSILGHTLWSSAIVEIIAAILQMRGGTLHGSMNIENLDPEIDLDVCANHAVKHSVEYLLKNSFGFGGINTSCLLKAYY